MYTSLEQRMASSYIDLFPRFIPEDSAEVSVSEQEEFYLLMKRLYSLAYEESLLFVSALHADDAYPNRFNKKSYGKPELLVSQKKFQKAVDTQLQTMFLLGQGKPVNLNKRQKEIFSRLGIEDLSFSGLPAAWKWMANRPESDFERFSHCFFKTGYPYTSELYAKLLGSAAFYKIENWMREHGYVRYDIKNIPASDCKIILAYANPAWSKEPPRGDFEYKVRHTGISVRYDAYIQKPCVLGICIPGGMKPYLEHFDEMTPALQDFILKKTKRCNACGYCIQTDKTGNRPFSHVRVNQGGDDSAELCPYFPGYRFCFTSLDEELADRIIEMLEFMDRFI